MADIASPKQRPTTDASGVVWSRLRTAWADLDSGRLPAPATLRRAEAGLLRRVLDAWGGGAAAADRFVALVRWRAASAHPRAQWLRDGAYGPITLLRHADEYDAIRQAEERGDAPRARRDPERDTSALDALLEEEVPHG